MNAPDGVWAVDNLVTAAPLPFTERLIAFEKRLQANMKDVFCPTHLCLGQEEVPAALHELLAPQDWLFSTHRAHGHYLAKGGSEQKLWDEIMGLETGLNGGFSGSQSFSDPSVNFHCSAIVGGLVGVAVGTAYALNLQYPFRQPQNEGFDAKAPIVVCCVGDAGTEQGVFWESLNFAALHKLPIAFIVENNGMSVDARLKERQATRLVPRVLAFGIEACESVKEAVICAGSGTPSFYEAHATLKCDHLNMATLLPTKLYE